jgi:hypothetical protein
MPKMQGKAVCSEVFKGEKATYYTFVPRDTGGELRLSCAAVLPGVVGGVDVDMDVLVKPRGAQKGANYLEILDGHIKPVAVKPE